MSRRNRKPARRCKEHSRNHIPSRQSDSRWQRRRELGQNFLRDARTAERIVEVSGVSEGDLVVEFGAGSGILTSPLSRKVARVLAVELDPHWAETLKARSRENVEVLHGDALHIALPERPFKVVSNLPFGITTRLLSRLLDDPASSPDSACLLVQDEVARKHARVSPTTLKTLSWSPFYELSSEMMVPARDFHPVPSVDGRLLRVHRRRETLLPLSSRGSFVEFIRFAFTFGTPDGIGRSLRRIFTKKQLARASREIGLDLTSPPSNVNVRQWIRLFELACKLGRICPSGGPTPPGFR